MHSRDILIVGSTRPGAIETAYTNALRRIGATVEQFDIEAPNRVLTRNRAISRLTSRLQDERAGQSLLAHLGQHASRYGMVLVFKGMALTYNSLARCKRLTSEAIWVNYNPDNPFNLNSRGSTNQNVLDCIPLYSAYGTWGRHLVSKLAEAGSKNPFYLPFGFDQDNHFPPEQPYSQRRKNITFVGAWDHQREALLESVADLPLQIHGYGWDRIHRSSRLRLKVKALNVYDAQLRATIGAATASINILRPQNYGAHNMRTFEIPAMGGLMVTTRTWEQAEYFPENTACLMYADADELRTTLERVADQSAEAAAIKHTAFELSKQHSYDARAQTLCEAIGFDVPGANRR